MHEYGGGSFCVGDHGVFISTKDGIYQLTEPKVLRPISINSEDQDYRYADLSLCKNFIFSVQERHNPKTSDVEPENLLVKINTDSGEVSIIVIFYMFRSDYSIIQWSLNSHHSVICIYIIMIFV